MPPKQKSQQVQNVNSNNGTTAIITTAPTAPPSVTSTIINTSNNTIPNSNIHPSLRTSINSSLNTNHSNSTVVPPPPSGTDVFSDIDHDQIRTRDELLRTVVAILVNSGSKHLRDPAHLSKQELNTQVQRYNPDERWIPYLKPYYTVLSKLGHGGYGKVYRARETVAADIHSYLSVDAKNNNNSAETQPPQSLPPRFRIPHVAIKVIDRAFVSQNPSRVKHLAVELAVLQLPPHPNINRRLALFHTDSHIIIILELCEAPRPTVWTRLCHCVAYRKPSKLGEIDRVYEEWKKQFSVVSASHPKRWRLPVPNQGPDENDANEELFGDFVDEFLFFKRLSVELQFFPGNNNNNSNNNNSSNTNNKTRTNNNNNSTNNTNNNSNNAVSHNEPVEIPSSASLFHMIVAYKRLSDNMSRVICRQILVGLRSLQKEYHVVHRDLKTENIVVAITRTAKEVRRSPVTGKIVGVQFDEKVLVKIVDFGLAKYFLTGNSNSYENSSYATSSTASVAPGTLSVTASNNTINNNNNNIGNHSRGSFLQRLNSSSFQTAVPNNFSLVSNASSTANAFLQQDVTAQFLSNQTSMAGFSNNSSLARNTSNVILPTQQQNHQPFVNPLIVTVNNNNNNSNNINSATDDPNRKKTPQEILAEAIAAEDIITITHYEVQETAHTHSLLEDSDGDNNNSSKGTSGALSHQNLKSTLPSQQGPDMLKNNNDDIHLVRPRGNNQQASNKNNLNTSTNSTTADKNFLTPAGNNAINNNNSNNRVNAMMSLQQKIQMQQQQMIMSEFNRTLSNMTSSSSNTTSGTFAADPDLVRKVSSHDAFRNADPSLFEIPPARLFETMMLQRSGGGNVSSFGRPAVNNNNNNNNNKSGFFENNNNNNNKGSEVDKDDNNNNCDDNSSSTSGNDDDDDDHTFGNDINDDDATDSPHHHQFRVKKSQFKSGVSLSMAGDRKLSSAFGAVSSSPSFPCVATPVGTDLYLALEALRGVLSFAQLRARWITTNKKLYKLDVYSTGVMLFCMSNGKPPFRPPPTYRKVAKEARMQQIEELVAAGPVFLQCVSAYTKRFALKMMENDVAKRLSVRTALDDPYVRDAKNALLTEFGLSGVASISMYDAGILQMNREVSSVTVSSDENGDRRVEEEEEEDDSGSDEADDDDGDGEVVVEDANADDGRDHDCDDDVFEEDLVSNVIVVDAVTGAMATVNVVEHQQNNQNNNNDNNVNDGEGQLQQQTEQKKQQSKKRQQQKRRKQRRQLDEGEVNELRRMKEDFVLLVQHNNDLPDQ